MPQGPKLPKNPALAWLQEGSSVMDAPWEGPVKSLLGWLGADDPNSGLMEPPILEAGSQIAAPLISIFKDKAAREAATETFKQNAHKLSPDIGKAADWIAQKYPRVAAHTDLNPEAIVGTHGASVKMSPGKVEYPIPMEVTKIGKWLLENDEASARGILAHELTHVAQALGNSNTDELYQLADKSMGYGKNPFEQTARRRERAAEMGRHRVDMNLGVNQERGFDIPYRTDRPYTAISKLKEYVTEGRPGADEMDRILKQRELGKAPPSHGTGAELKVSVGPNAIPLSDEDGYLRKVALETLRDLRQTPPTPGSDLGQQIQRNRSMAEVNPNLSVVGSMLNMGDDAVKYGIIEPDEVDTILRASVGTAPPEKVDKAIRELSNAFTPGRPR